MRSYETTIASRYPTNRFHFLHRDRHDIDNHIAVLGCPLWTCVLPEQATEVQRRLTDFNDVRGIGHGWDLQRHLREHREDVQWLNDQVQEISANEPQRHIVILSHHSPTIDTRAIDPAHFDSTVSSAFATDLS